MQHVRMKIRIDPSKVSKSQIACNTPSQNCLFDHLYYKLICVWTNIYLHLLSFVDTSGKMSYNGVQ